jgi:hypothetical protein
MGFVDQTSLALQAEGWRLTGRSSSTSGVCPACVNDDDAEGTARRDRVAVLCRSLDALVALSAEQQRQFDQIVGQLEVLTEQARPPAQATPERKGKDSPPHA